MTGNLCQICPQCHKGHAAWAHILHVVLCHVVACALFKNSVTKFSGGKSKPPRGCLTAALAWWCTWLPAVFWFLLIAVYCCAACNAFDELWKWTMFKHQSVSTEGNILCTTWEKWDWGKWTQELTPLSSNLQHDDWAGPHMCTLKDLPVL